MVAGIVLGASVSPFNLVIAYVTLGQLLGQGWGNLDGLEPVWPARCR